MGNDRGLQEAADALIRATRAGHLSDDQADQELAALNERILKAMVAGEISDEEVLLIAERTGLGMSIYREPDDHQVPGSGG
jgi:hypothetical protein